MPSIDELNIPSRVQDSLYALSSIVGECRQVEKSYSIIGPEKYWNLSTVWIEPIWRWLAGEHASVICGDYGLFEGNFVRSVLRVANLVDETIGVATFSHDLETLEKLKGVRGQLIRDFLIPDSLYLHL
jgi:superfamily II RNA helicase